MKVNYCDGVFSAAFSVYIRAAGQLKILIAINLAFKNFNLS